MHRAERVVMPARGMAEDVGVPFTEGGGGRASIAEAESGHQTAS